MNKLNLMNDIQLLVNNENEICSVMFFGESIEGLRWVLKRALNTAPPEEHQGMLQLDALLNGVELPSSQSHGHQER